MARDEVVARAKQVAAPFCHEVDLDSCTTSAAVLNWIMQVAGKQWATPAGAYRPRVGI